MAEAIAAARQRCGGAKRRGSIVSGEGLKGEGVTWKFAAERLLIGCVRMRFGW